MRRRRLLLLSVVLALLVLLGWLLLRTPWGLGRPTPANFGRVQAGMTAKEVEAILGPDVEYARRLPSAPPPMRHGDFVWRVKDQALLGYWLSDDVEFAVEYDNTDGPIEQWRVASKCSFEYRHRSRWDWLEKVFGPR